MFACVFHVFYAKLRSRENISDSVFNFTWMKLFGLFVTFCQFCKLLKTDSRLMLILLLAWWNRWTIISVVYWAFLVRCRFESCDLTGDLACSLVAVVTSRGFYAT